MKKLFLLATFVVTLFTSCLKEKSYTCSCTYVPGFTHPSGTPNKTESTTVKGRLREQALSDCQIDNEGKYSNQDYKGTCELKD